MADKIQQANDRLKKGRIGVAIELRGDRLSLRATLPPKPGETGPPRQQRIALGVRLNADGLDYAESEAKIVGGLVAKGCFDWHPYLASSPHPETVGDWIEKLKSQYFSEREKDDTTLGTWNNDYMQAFKRLTAHDSISPEILKKTILENTKPNTRTRRRYAMAYSRLADLAGLTHDLRGLTGNYSPRAVSPRSLPDDSLIATVRESINSEAWRWVYGLMAAYGLRNHEVFFTDLLDWPIAYVNRGKTEERYVWPLYPEWADRWELNREIRPDVTGKKNGDLGSRVTHAFSRAGVPFSPYNLRHCWAVRSIEFGLDVSLAASQMGHSVKVHTEIYHLWITRKTHERAMAILLNRSDRPLPPL
jgi:integrase